MKKRRYLFFLFVPLVLIVLAAIVMFLWNAILPDIAHVERLTYPQAFGLLILSKILFGGFRFPGRGRPYFGPPPHIRAKWMNMSDEERLKFKEEWRRRCGGR
jgi:hypothetical protein